MQYDMLKLYIHAVWMIPMVKNGTLLFFLLIVIIKVQFLRIYSTEFRVWAQTENSAQQK